MWNSASFAKEELVVIPSHEVGTLGHWVNAKGQIITAQLEAEQWLVLLPQVPSLGFSTIAFQESAAALAEPDSFEIAIDEQRLSTPFYEIRWNESGQLVSIWDKSCEREVLAEGERGNVLQVFEDKPKDFEAWDIDIFYQEKMKK